MVQRMWSENKKLETADLAGGKRPMKLEEIDQELSVHKRRKLLSSQITNESNLDINEFPFPPYRFNPLNEPSPLGLRLKKSPSLLDLIQTRLSQCNNNKHFLPTENLQVGNNKARVGTSGPIDKLKASNFPALLLRIGQWEYVSQNEGDLVAKCYFAKHKLVWEVLYGGLKNKIEIQWADIVALKENFPDYGPATLTIVLGKQPLFFRETDPQPRKHPLWQAASDFTNGEASTYRQHYLQCAQGVLNKHYEKLIQCDTRLNFLSQQLDTVLDFPFDSIKDLNISGNNVVNRPEMSTIGMVKPSVSQHSFFTPSDLVHGNFTKDIHDTDSAVSINEYGFGGSYGLQGPKTTMSISDLVNHIGHCISEPKSAGILPLLENVSSAGVNQKDAIENISEILLNDTHLPTASDEKTLLSRVDSLCSLLQDSNDGNDSFTPNGIMSRKDSFSDLLNVSAAGGNQKDAIENISEILLNDTHLPTASDEKTLLSRVDSLCSLLQDSNDGNDSFTPNGIMSRKDSFSDLLNVSAAGGNQKDAIENISEIPLNDTHLPTASDEKTLLSRVDSLCSLLQDSNDGNDSFTPNGIMSRKDSFSDLLNELPRFLFDISEDGEILNPKNGIELNL